MSNTAIIVATTLTFLLSIFFFSMRLETIIKHDGVYVRFFPFHRKYKHYAWANTTKCFVREYCAITEYGGWGLRVGMFGQGMAFNVAGNKGLQLEFTDRKRLLIGTNKPEELSSYLVKIGQLKQS